MLTTYVYLNHGKDELHIQVEIPREGKYTVLHADGCDYETGDIYAINDIDELGIRLELNHKVAEAKENWLSENSCEENYTVPSIKELNNL